MRRAAEKQRFIPSGDSAARPAHRDLSILVRCKVGLGRAGTIAANLLIEVSCPRRLGGREGRAYRHARRAGARRGACRRGKIGQHESRRRASSGTRPGTRASPSPQLLRRAVSRCSPWPLARKTKGFGPTFGLSTTSKQLNELEDCVTSTPTPILCRTPRCLGRCRD